jgi:hypothetical protein
MCITGILPWRTTSQKARKFTDNATDAVPEFRALTQERLARYILADVEQMMKWRFGF